LVVSLPKKKKERKRALFLRRDGKGEKRETATSSATTSFSDEEGRAPFFLAEKGKNRLACNKLRTTTATAGEEGGRGFYAH